MRPISSTVTLDQAMIAVLVSSVLALAARLTGSLSSSGAYAAFVVGSLTVASDARFGVLLAGYFLVSVALSKARAADKWERLRSVVNKGGPRDAQQVVANGGVFAILCVLTAFTAGHVASRLTAAAVGALAASTADTWATEIGTLLRGTPRSLRTRQPVPQGTSGGVSVAGTVAMTAGALFIAELAALLELSRAATVLTVAGVCGAVTDSLIGATLQDRRWCAACHSATERRVHSCGASTNHSGGLEWLDNDVVNLMATVVGAAVAGLLVRL